MIPTERLYPAPYLASRTAPVTSRAQRYARMHILALRWQRFGMVSAQNAPSTQSGFPDIGIVHGPAKEFNQSAGDVVINLPDSARSISFNHAFHLCKHADDNSATPSLNQSLSDSPVSVLIRLVLKKMWQAPIQPLQCTALLDSCGWCGLKWANTCCRVGTL